MALYLKVRDNRWQFSFGSKYMVIADVVADPGTMYVTGGTPILISSRDPQVKSTRAPWFMAFSSVSGLSAGYIPSDLATLPAGQNPSTTLANANSGSLIIFEEGVEVAGDLSTILTVGALQAMCIFQGME